MSKKLAQKGPAPADGQPHESKRSYKRDRGVYRPANLCGVDRIQRMHDAGAEALLSRVDRLHDDGGIGIHQNVRSAVRVPFARQALPEREDRVGAATR